MALKDSDIAKLAMMNYNTKLLLGIGLCIPVGIPLMYSSLLDFFFFYTDFKALGGLQILKDTSIFYLFLKEQIGIIIIINLIFTVMYCKESLNVAPLTHRL